MFCRTESNPFLIVDVSWSQFRKHYYRGFFYQKAAFVHENSKLCIAGRHHFENGRFWGIFLQHTWHISYCGDYSTEVHMVEKGVGEIDPLSTSIASVLPFILGPHFFNAFVKR